MEQFGKPALDLAQYTPLLWLQCVDDTFVVWSHGPKRSENGHKLFTIFQTRSKLCLKDPLTNFGADCPTNSGTAEMYTADECKMAVSPPPAKDNVCVAVLDDKVCDMDNRHDCRVWGSESSHAICK
jgi:hypothetical protein